jgi:glycosidase
MQYLDKVLDALAKLPDYENYYVPGLWTGRRNRAPQNVNPREFYTSKINHIRETESKAPDSGPFVYNMFVRLAAAYDHDRNGKIAASAAENGWRETGTFLKAIAMIPYIKSLGANIIYVLPVTSIGRDQRKGNLGSPYAIRNPVELDENLAEPALGLDAETEFAAFTEAAHAAGMKVVAEFVFRTASVDTDLALSHPEWFYWIKADTQNRSTDSQDENLYGPPVFTESTLEKIKSKVNNQDYEALPEPSDKYKNLFVETPDKAVRIDDKIRGKYDSGAEARIPGAFADWPPDDNQPVWSDVTYYKLYDHPGYNYIAYNTVRMYDEALAREKYRREDLWEFIRNIVPDYIDKFSIDGVMVDMGHALPAELRARIIETARSKKEGFIFWEENFVLDPKSVKDGYDAAIGYLPFDEHIPRKMRELLLRLDRGECPIDFFAASESHNTPRTASRPGGIEFAKLAWTINAFLPTIQFIHAGFELGETQPVNTGLGFTDEEIRRHPAQNLPLFSAAALTWDNPGEITDYIRSINEIRRKYIINHNNALKEHIKHIECNNDQVVAFIRVTRGEMPNLLIVANMSSDNIEETYLYIKDYCRINLPDGTDRYDIIDGSTVLSLAPWECKILEVLE